MEGTTIATTVEAAGGVVLRSRDGRTEVLAVHRPKYDDWSLPKGKLDEGEDWRDAALREVAEETHVACELGTELSEIRYTDPKGRPKRVRWWLMRPVEDGSEDREPDDEVDAVRWIDTDLAATELTYDHDHELVTEALEHAE